MTSAAIHTVRMHMAAIRARDLDAIVATYAPDAVHADPHRIGRGLDHVRAVHAEALDVAADLQPEVELMAEGDVVVVSWLATTAAGSGLVGSDTFVVTGGLISVHTTAIAADARAGGRLVEEVA